LAEIDPEYVKHQYLYVPYLENSAVDTVAVGKAIGLWVAAQHRVQPTVVCPQKSNANFSPELAKLTAVTERSGIVKDGGVILAWCPTHKVMDKVRNLEKSVIILVEWPTESFEGWAKLMGAYNVITRTTMKSGLTDMGRKALESIVWEGYNGWNDDIARNLTTKRLQDLVKAGQYDREIVLEYARVKKGNYGIDRLKKIVEKFELTLSD